MHGLRMLGAAEDWNELTISTASARPAMAVSLQLHAQHLNAMHPLPPDLCTHYADSDSS